MISIVSTRLSKQVDNSQDNSTYNINLNEQYIQHNNIQTKNIATTSTTNISQDKDLRHGKHIKFNNQKLYNMI